MAIAAAPPPPAYYEATDQACHNNQVTMTSHGEILTVSLNTPNQRPPARKPDVPDAKPAEIQARGRQREAARGCSGAPIAIPGI